jgi:hypothetical protein
MCETDYKYFCGFFENKLLKTIFVSISTVVYSFNALLFYGIIWYERYGSDTKRILTNKIVSMICWNNLVIIPVVVVTDVAIYFFGPLKEEYCFAFLVLRNIVKSDFLFLLNAIILSRYILIFWLKNPASVNDDFWSLYVCLLSVLCSSVFNISVFLLPQKHSIFYYSCSDLDPTIHQHLEKPKTAQLEVLICFLLHLVIIIKIKCFRAKQQQQPSTTQVATVANPSSETTLQKIDKEALADIALNVCNIFCAIVYVSLQLKVNSFTLKEANEFPNYIYMYAYQLWMPCIASFAVSFGYYARRPKLRKKIAQREESVLHWICTCNIQ